MASAFSPTLELVPTEPHTSGKRKLKDFLQERQLQDLRQGRNTRSLVAQHSPNISNQGDLETCYAHAIVRVVLRAIKQVIPTYFYPTDEDDCNDVIDKDAFDNLTGYITAHSCSDKSTNNLLMFVFLYKLVIKKFGCNSGSFYKSLFWLGDLLQSTSLEDMEFDETNISLTHLEQIQNMLVAFRRKIGPDKKHNFTINYELFKEGLSSEKSHELEQTFLDVLNRGFYIVISTNRHALAVVGYEQPRDASPIFIVKNSWGKCSFGVGSDADILGVACNNGLFKMDIMQMLGGTKTGYGYLLLRSWNYEDMHKGKFSSVTHELLRRRFPQSAQSAGNRRTAKQSRGPRQRTRLMTRQRTQQPTRRRKRKNHRGSS